MTQHITAAARSRGSLQRSAQIWQRAQSYLPGGVFDPSHFTSPHPTYFERAEGAYLIDVDGNRYLDLNSAHSAVPLGHLPREVVAAVTDQLAKGTYFKQPSPLAVDLAEVLCERIPSAEKVVFTDSGAKATNYAVRLARTLTGRVKFAKFRGGYHGAWDGALVGLPGRYGRSVVSGRHPGVPPSVEDECVVLEFNDLNGCDATLAEHGDQLAAVIVEPILGDGSIVPAPGFHELLRERCDRHGIVLIYDEIVSLGVGPGGAQDLYGVTPDLTAIGKNIGGGFPIGAVVGRDEFMQVVDPMKNAGPLAMLFGASFGGHPFAIAAGLAQQRLLDERAYATLWRLGAIARDGINAIGARRGLQLSATGVGQYLTMHWTGQPVVDHRAHRTCDSDILATVASSLAAQSFLGSGGTRYQVNTAMTDDDVHAFVAAVDNAFDTIAA